MTIAYDPALASARAPSDPRSTIERHIEIEKARAKRKRLTNRLLAAGFGLFVLFPGGSARHWD